MDTRMVGGNNRRMRGRIILQDISTHRYLAPDNSWTQSCQQAKVFEHTYQALLEGLSLHNTPTQMVWCFRNPAANLYVAVHPQDSNRIQACVSCPLS
jgi:hypothetical protein